MSKKRTLVAILIAVLVVLGLIGFYVYQRIAAVQNLQVSLVDVKADQITWKGLRLGFTLQISNPNPVDVTVGRFNASLYANNIHLTYVELLEPIPLRPQESVQQTFYLTASYLDLGAVILESIKNKQTNWIVRGEYILQLPFGITYPYKFEISPENR